MVKRLFELEVPEIFDGIVEVKSIAREGDAAKLHVVHRDVHHPANIYPSILCPPFMMDKIIQALTTAYKKDHEGVENVIVDVDEVKKRRETLPVRGSMRLTTPVRISCCLELNSS